MKNALHILGFLALFYIINYWGEWAYVNNESGLLDTCFKTLYRAGDFGRPFINILLAFMLGAGMEVLQWLLFRSKPEEKDVLMYGIGGCIGLALYLLFPYSDLIFYGSIAVFSICTFLFIFPKFSQKYFRI